MSTNRERRADPSDRRRRRRLPGRALALLAIAALAAACAARPPMKGAPLGPAPSSVDEALAQLDLAEGDIDRSLGGAPASRPMVVAPGEHQQPGYPPPAQAAPAPMAPPPPPGGAAERAAEPSAVQASSDPCFAACRALASMERAAGHLCSLAGAEDGRCVSAQARLRAATERVHAGCPSCS